MKTLRSTLKILRAILLLLVFFVAVIAMFSGFEEAATSTGGDPNYTVDLIVGAVGSAVACTMFIVFCVRNLGE